MKSYLYPFLFLFLTSISFAQEKVTEDNSLNGQFDKIYRISSSYQVYKVIGKDKFLQLKQNVLDSIKASETLIQKKDNLLTAERENNQKVKIELSKTAEELKLALNKENSISLFGMQVSKIAYNVILWGIIAVLLLCLLYFIFKFSRSNIITNEANNSLQDVEYEFEQHRKKSIEREQKLRRQLQDEVNKQRNS